MVAGWGVDRSVASSVGVDRSSICCCFDLNLAASTGRQCCKPDSLQTRETSLFRCPRCGFSMSPLRPGPPKTHNIGLFPSSDLGVIFFVRDPVVDTCLVGMYVHQPLWRWFLFKIYVHVAYCSV